LPAKTSVFTSKDTIMVLTKLKHARQISEVLAKDAEKSVISQSSFFGDFVLNGSISLSDLDAFYTINIEDQDKQQTLAGYITQRYHRRVVIGDQVQLDKLLLTVRQVNDAGEATQVGIKPVAD
jgi:cell volume regulation protein A